MGERDGVFQLTVSFEITAEMFYLKDKLWATFPIYFN